MQHRFLPSSSPMDYFYDEDAWLARQLERPHDANESLDYISVDMARFLNIRKGTPVRRDKVKFKLQTYLQKNHLFLQRTRGSNPSERFLFYKDETLSALFPGKRFERVADIDRLIGRHIVTVKRSRSCPGVTHRRDLCN